MTAEDATTQHAGLSDVETAINELDKVFQPLSEAGPSNKRIRSSSRKNTSVSTPALMSVLPPSRKRQRLSWLSEEQLKKVRSPVQVYRPSSREDLIERIATFTLTLWNDRKPEGCSAVDFASNGWRCTGKKREEVSCDVCKTTWSIATPAGSAVNGEAMQRDIREKHAKSCSWRSKSCPPDLYRLHVSAPPQQLLREVLERASSFPPDLRFTVKHPLSEEQDGQLYSVVTSPRGQSILRNVHGNGGTNGSIDHNALVAALFGWAVPSASTSSAPSSPSPSTSASTTASSIVQCKLCARRLAVKGIKQSSNRNTTEENAADNAESTQLPSVSPEKLSSVDVLSSHRRFCPYTSPASNSAPRPLGYEALLERITHLDHHAEQLPVTFEPTSSDRTKTNLVQTREALRYVKNLLEGGHSTKRKYAMA